MNAILYVDRTCVPWGYLPHDFAPWATVYGYFAKWQQEGVFEQFTGLLRRLVREVEGRRAGAVALSAGLPDLKTSANVHLAGHGTRTPRNGSSGASATSAGTPPGLLLTVLVTAASVSDPASDVT